MELDLLKYGYKQLSAIIHFLEWEAVGGRTIE